MTLLGLLMLTLASPLETPAATPEPEAQVPLFGRQPLRDFVPDATRDDAVYIQDERKNWYYATLTGQCPELRWARSIGISNRGGKRLDQYAELVVGGSYCAIDSVKRSAAPVERPKIGAAKKAG